MKGPLAAGAAILLMWLTPGPAFADAVDFTDWTSVTANVATGTLHGQSVSLSGTHVWDPPVSEVGGRSTFFADATLFTPALALSDHIQISGFDSTYSYTLAFGAPATDPTLHLASVGSTVQFPTGTQIVRVSGAPDFVVSGSTVIGHANDDSPGGTVRLIGTFSSISFTATTLYAPPIDDGVVLQVGAAPTPPPPPPPPPPMTVADADHDGILDAADDCPTAPNADQADGDRDRIGDACELLPPGNLPPVAGVRAVTKLLAGSVQVKLPGASGYVPLAGVASLPVGATVDARAGSVSLTSAINRAGKKQSATVAAGIFRIRQQRAKGRATVATDLVLATPPGRSRACAAKKAPRKGVVRKLTVVSKGVFRTVAAKAVAKGRNATWTAADRCDGTLTKVTRGKVAVKAGRRTRTVRAGHSLLIRAKLFAARQRR